MKQCKTSDPFGFTVEEEDVCLELLLYEEIMSAQSIFTLERDVRMVENVSMTTLLRISYPR